MDMTTPSGAASHEVFRQAMMQRLRAQSQELSTVLGNLSTPGSVHTMCATPSYKAWPRQQHIQRDAVSEHSRGRVGSPASRALESIRSALDVLPTEPTVASSAAAAPHAGSSRPSTAEKSHLGSSRRPSRPDASLPGSNLVTSINESDQGSTGMLPGIERELNRLLGPKKATAGPSVSSPAMQSTPAADRAAAACSESGSLHNEPGSLARVHSNPLFREDRDSTTAAGAQVLQALEDGSDGFGQERGWAGSRHSGAGAQHVGKAGEPWLAPKLQQLLHMLAESIHLVHDGCRAADGVIALMQGNSKLIYCGKSKLRHWVHRDLKAYEEHSIELCQCFA